MEDIVFVGDWIKDRVLGSGSFGIVVLWKHKRTEEKLAIKTCKWGNELTSKHRERWTKEVEMLQNCNNPNIVGTKELPKEFLTALDRANPSGLPILCMEYCSGGDLRQLLNKPDSCAGLKEVQVRQILGDIRNAMQFLHNNKITHRDLKPENIVMHVQDNAGISEIGAIGQPKVIYKLIDLGYAKEIDSNSICASFVGTLQYLAPELLYSKTYSNSVDYWSLGLLAFELICGVRPFLPFMAPAQWMMHVKNKAHDNICVYESFHGDIEYSNELYPENHISKPLRVAIEEWLRVALEWDPKLRGRDSPSRVTFNIPAESNEGGSNIVIFSLLEKILKKKIIKIFSVSTLAQLAYEIDDIVTINTLKTWIERETNIPLNQQILISNCTYCDIGNDEIVSRYCSENSKSMLFLYNKSYIIKENLEPVVPKAVQRCLEHPKTVYNFKNGQNLYRSSLYFVMSQMENYDFLINGLYTKAESLKHESKQLLLKHNVVDKSIGQLVAKAEMVTKMKDTGKDHIKELKETSNATQALGGFDSTFKETDDCIENINKLQSAWTQLSIRLQSAARRSNEILSVDLNNFVLKYNYQNVFTNALKCYIAFKKNEFSSENRGREKQCHDIMKTCYDCLKLRGKILQELHHQPFILKFLDLSTEFDKISDIIINASENTEKLNSELNKNVEELNNCMWATIKLCSKGVHNISDIPYSVLSFEKREFKIGEPVSKHCFKMSSNKIEENDQLGSLIEESLKIKQNHVHLIEKLNLQKSLLNKTHFDFSFLNNK